MSTSPASELTSFENERFSSLARSTSLPFLHLMRKVASMPIKITAAANGIKSHELQPLAAGTGTGATGSGVLAGSADELAAAAGDAASAAGLLTDSEDELTIAGILVAAAAGVAECFPELAANRAE